MSVTSPVDSAPAKDQAENVSMPGTLSRSEIKKLKGKGRAAPEDVDYVMVSGELIPREYMVIGCVRPAQPPPVRLASTAHL